VSRKSLVPIELPADPTLALEAATKQYVDRDGGFLAPVRIASTGNINLTTNGLAAVDGVTPSAGDRVLAKDQSPSSTNGIYVASAGVWTRATDFATAPIPGGLKVRVTEGNQNKIKTYTLQYGVNDFGTDSVWFKNIVTIDFGGSLSYPTPHGTGHLYYDSTNNCIAVWDNAAVVWRRAGNPIICTSSTRPSNISDGLLIYETDTGLAYIRSGGAWASFGGGGGGGFVTGMMMIWPTGTPPSGWLVCDGTAIPGGNTALIALVGANTPDMRDRVPVGVSATKAVGTTGGVTNASVTLTTTELPAHAHTITHDHNARMSTSTGAGGMIPRGTATEALNTNNPIMNSNTANSGSVGSGTAFSVQDPYRAVNYIIKT